MRNEIIGAIARGWCSPENSHKEMDTTLAEAIANEVMKVVDAKFTSGNSGYAKCWCDYIEINSCVKYMECKKCGSKEQVDRKISELQAMKFVSK